MKAVCNSKVQVLIAPTCPPVEAPMHCNHYRHQAEKGQCLGPFVSGLPCQSNVANWMSSLSLLVGFLTWPLFGSGSQMSPIGFYVFFTWFPADSTVWEEMSEACLIGGGTLGEDFWGDDNLVLILVSCHVGRHNCTVLQPQMTQQPCLPTCDGLYP